MSLFLLKPSDIIVRYDFLCPIFDMAPKSICHWLFFLKLWAWPTDLEGRGFFSNLKTLLSDTTFSVLFLTWHQSLRERSSGLQTCVKWLDATPHYSYETGALHGQRILAGKRRLRILNTASKTCAAFTAVVLEQPTDGASRMGNETSTAAHGNSLCLYGHQ